MTNPEASANLRFLSLREDGDTLQSKVQGAKSSMVKVLEMNPHTPDGSGAPLGEGTLPPKGRVWERETVKPLIIQQEQFNNGACSALAVCGLGINIYKKPLACHVLFKRWPERWGKK